MEGRLTLYLVNKAFESQIKNLARNYLKAMMNDGLLDDASPAILGVSFIDDSSQGVQPGNPIVDEDDDVGDPDTILPIERNLWYVIGGFIISLTLIGVIARYRYSSQFDDNGDIISDEEDSSDNFIEEIRTATPQYVERSHLLVDHLGDLVGNEVAIPTTVSNVQMRSMPPMGASPVTKSLHSIEEENYSTDSELAAIHDALSDRLNVGTSDLFHKFYYRFHFSIDGKHGMMVALIDKFDTRSVEMWFNQQSSELWNELIEVYNLKKGTLRWGFGLGDDYDFTDFRIATISELPLYANNPKIPLNVYIFDEGGISNFS